MQTSALFYLAAILLVIGLVTNLLALVIVRRFEVKRTGSA
jgi:ABC-type phosphate transport system permease subunit